MTAEFMQVGFAPGPAWVALREVAGCDEEATTGTDAQAAIRLLDRLLLPEPAAAAGPGEAEKLPVSARDRLLAEVFRRTFGDKIGSVVSCRGCGVRFDLDFSLGDLIDYLAAESRQAAASPQPDGTFRLPNGARFRLPTGEDEAAVRGLAPDEAATQLLARCVIDGDPAGDGPAIAAAMETVGPLLNCDLDAVCPECGATQLVRFDVQSYLLTALAQEQPRLTLDVHRLATAYGWSRAEILTIPRGRRRAHVALIEAEAPRPRRSG